jgi:DnaJ-class molecular chaperone
MTEHEKPKRVLEETQEICSLCGGRGQESNYQSTAMFTTCRQCHGSGFIVTKRIIRSELTDDFTV